MEVTVIAAILSSGVLAAIAVVHLVWAQRRWWPVHSEAELVEMVVGTRGRMPNPLACITVASALIVAAAIVVVAANVVVVATPISSNALRRLSWIVAAVFAFRGLFGYFDHRLRPQILELRFYRLNRRFYSPLCLALATLVAVSLVTS